MRQWCLLIRASSLHNFQKSRVILFGQLQSMLLNHCLKIFHIQSYSGPYFRVFGLNTGRYSVPFGIQSECGKIRTRITPNMNTFHAVNGNGGWLIISTSSFEILSIEMTCINQVFHLEILELLSYKNKFIIISTWAYKNILKSRRVGKGGGYICNSSLLVQPASHSISH